MAKVRTRKRGNTFSYLFEAGKENGKRKVIEKGGFDSPDAAYDAGVEAYNKFKHGQLVADSKTSLRDFINRWFDLHKSELKGDTIQTYRVIINKHIIPKIGNYTLSELKPVIIDDWIKRQIHLSKSSITRNLMLLKEVLDYAVYPAQILSDNPARYIKTPKSTSKRKIERYIIPYETMKKITEEIYPPGHDYHLPIVISYYTGIRLSETFGLMWKDIDFKKSTITINQQLKHAAIQKGHVTAYISTPKTPTSTRTILITDILASELKKYKTTQAENKLRYGESYINSVMIEKNIEGKEYKTVELKQKCDIIDKDNILDFVCTRAAGKYIKDNSFEDINRSLQKKGIDFNFHSLRHTHATVLMENNAKSKDIAVRLGHSSTKITEDLYTHDTPKMQKETVSILDKIYADK